LLSHEVVGQLIGVTTMRAGLTVNAKLDKRQYPTNVKVTTEEMASLNHEPHAFRGEWNYTIRPSRLYLPVGSHRVCSSHLSRFSHRPSRLIRWPL
jgi:hypothetical protein